MKDVKLIYLMDPHCGWCFGYCKTITEFYGSVIQDSSISFEIFTGGLFIPGRKGSSEFADDKRPIAARVQQRFGVKFSPSYFENVLAVSWIDSTPASKAICACHILAPSKSLYFSNSIIEAAFINGRNISLPEVILEIAEEQGFDPQSFGETVGSQRVADALDSYRYFSAMAKTGFPAVFLQDNDQNTLVHLGGANLSVSDLRQAVDEYL